MRAARAVLVTTIGCLLLPGSGLAQILVVTIVEESGQRPIGGADVAVIGTDSATIARASSDSSGTVQFRLPAAGEFAIQVDRLGYLSWRSDAVRVAEGESLELEVRLGSNAIPLEPLTVVTCARTVPRLEGFRERLARGPSGSFVTRDDIERRPSAAITELVRPLTGVNIVDVPRTSNPFFNAQLIVMRGIRNSGIASLSDASWCLPGIFVDGILVEQSAEFPIDDFIASPQLEGIEVYTTAASVPIQYQQGGSITCGAVLLWTRAAESGDGRTGWLRWVVGLGAFGGVLLFLAR